MTDKKDEALKLALEALEGFEPNTFIGSDAELLCHAAITAILEALAEPEEKYRYGTPLLDAMTGNAEQPVQQEWPKPKFVRNVDGVPCITLVEHEYLMRSRTSPPASKPWVWLTEQEKERIRNAWGLRTYRAIEDTEAKLREKNNG